MVDIGKIEKCIEDLEYDFSIFEVDSFLQAVGQHIGKAILVSSVLLNHAQGAWVSSNYAEHIFYRTGINNRNKLRVLLHEAGHILLKHDTLMIGDSGGELKFKSVFDRDELEELEAESFSAIIFSMIGSNDLGQGKTTRSQLDKLFDE